MKFALRLLAGVLLALLALELAFRLLPVSTATHTGYYINPLILTYPPHHTFTTSTGWDLKNPQYHRANNYGFLTSRDFVPNPQALGLVGDSYIEANMLPEQERLAARLEKALGGRPVFSLGGPGSNLLDYAERIRFAHETFGIDEFVVVLERGDIRQALCGSGNVHGRCLDPRTLAPQTEVQPPPGLAKRLFRESALAQYVFSQLKFDLAALLRSAAPPPAPPATRTASSAPGEPARAAVDAFFARLDDLPRLHLIFLIDAAREKLFDDGAQADPAFDFLAAVAAKHGAAVVSPTPLFRAYRQETGRILEVGSYDHHWNKDAVALVTAALLPALGNGGAQPPATH